MQGAVGRYVALRICASAAAEDDVGTLEYFEGAGDVSEFDALVREIYRFDDVSASDKLDG